MMTNRNPSVGARVVGTIGTLAGIVILAVAKADDKRDERRARCILAQSKESGRQNRRKRFVDRLNDSWVNRALGEILDPRGD